MRNIGWKTIGCNCCWSLKQALCSSYLHRKWKGMKTFPVGNRENVDGRFFIFFFSKWNRRTTLGLFKLSQTAREKRLVKRANVASERLTSRWGNEAWVRTALKKCLQKTVSLGVLFFFFFHWFGLRCVWRFITFLVYWSNKQKNA